LAAVVFFVFVFAVFALVVFLVVVVVLASSAKTTTVLPRNAKPSIRVINLFILCGSPLEGWTSYLVLNPSYLPAHEPGLKRELKRLHVRIGTKRQEEPLQRETRFAALLATSRNLSYAVFFVLTAFSPVSSFARSTAP